MSNSDAKIRWLRALSGAHAYHPIYHAAGDHDMPHLRHLIPVRTIQQFEADLEFFLRNYTPVSLEDANSALSGGRPLPKNAMLLTVDDGLREVHDVMAPMLLQKGCPAAFYLCSDFVDNRNLGWKNKVSLLLERIANVTPSEQSSLAAILGLHGDIPTAHSLKGAISAIPYKQRHLLDSCAELLQLSFDEFLVSYQPYMTSANVEKLLQQGFAIGSHSIDHANFSELTEKDCLNQARQCMDWLEERFGAQLRSFAHPFSNVGLSERHIRQLMGEGGFKIILGTSGGKTDIDARVIHRNAIEDWSQRTAEQIVADYLVRYVPRRLSGRQTLQRPAA